LLAMTDIGQTLLEARMRARIDIGEVEARTKIRAKYLRALENEEWDLLPGSVYVKSFLRTYGDYLGLDSRLLIDEYKRRYEHPSEHDLRPMASIARDRERQSRGPRGPRISPGIVVGVVLIAVLAALAAIGSLSGNAAKAPPTPRIGSARRTGKRGRRRSTTSTTATSPTTTTSASSSATSSKLATLSLTPTGTVYVCVERVLPSGEQPVIATIYQPGQTIPSVSGRELLVTLGNAAITVKADGSPYPLTSGATPIGLKVTPAGATPLQPGQDPTCQ
jgi:cytoskeleton protein RodZ